MNLYLCDNGALYCDDHLGATAKATGRDISGQPIHKCSDADLSALADAIGSNPQCEQCAISAGNRAALAASTTAGAKQS